MIVFSIEFWGKIDNIRIGTIVVLSFGAIPWFIGWLIEISFYTTIKKVFFIIS